MELALTEKHHQEMENLKNEMYATYEKNRDAKNFLEKEIEKVKPNNCKILITIS